MNKAVIATGGKQYLVKEGETLEVELLNFAEQEVSFVPLLVIKDDAVMVGQPLLESMVVSAEVIDADKKADKVTAIRYKAKKRVHKLHGHRQHHDVIKITKIV